MDEVINSLKFSLYFLNLFILVSNLDIASSCRINLLTERQIYSFHLGEICCSLWRYFLYRKLKTNLKIKVCVYLKCYNCWTGNTACFQAHHAQVHNSVLPTGVLGDKDWNNSPVFAGPIQLTYKIKIKNDKKWQVKTFSLYIGLPNSSSFWGLPTLLFQSSAHKLALTIIPTQLKLTCILIAFN